MIRSVTTDKLSATVDAELLAEVRDRAGPRGLSDFVSRALRHELDHVALREFLDELAGEIGAPDEAMVAEADALLDELAKSTRRRSRRAPAA